MQLKKLQRLSSVMAMFLLVAGVSQTVSAGKKEKAGPLKTRTGVITEIQEGKITLDLGKRGNLNVGLDPQILVWKEETGKLAEIKVGEIVRIKGKGQDMHLTASRLVILPTMEKLEMHKISKADPAYGKEVKSVEVKAKVAKLEPLMVMNRKEQSLKVVLDSKSCILRQVRAKPEDLRPGMKVQIQYRRQKSGNQAIKVIIRLKKETKQSKS
ncbi:hypothetical protein KAR10_09230 [bacterium]|nr:hypothetical protein [bacterium]